MKKKRLLILLLIETVLIGTLYGLCGACPKLFSEVLTFPFAQIGKLICFLQLGNDFSKGLAVTVWIAVSLIPAFFLFFYRREKAVIPECVTLLFLSGVILYILYFVPFMDPTVEDITFPWGSRSLPIRSEMLVAVMSIWGIVFLYFILLIMRKIRTGTKEQLRRYLGILLCICSFLYIAFFTYTVLDCTKPLSHFTSLSTEEQVRTVVELLRPVSYLLTVFVFVSVLDFFDVSSRNPGQDLSAYSSRVSRMCCIALGFTAALTAVSNIVLYIMTYLRRYYAVVTPVSVSFDFTLPVDSLVFVVTILLILHLTKENRKLQEDNDLFI